MTDEAQFLDKVLADKHLRVDRKNVLLHLGTYEMQRLFDLRAKLLIVRQQSEVNQQVEESLIFEEVKQLI